MKSRYFSRVLRFLPLAIVAMIGSTEIRCGTPNATFEVSVPSSVLAQAKWIEVGAFAACPSAAELAGGLPVSGMLDRVAFEQGGLPPPLLGSLPPASYGFAAVVHADDCTVLAGGCSVVDLKSKRDVNVRTTEITPDPATQCTAGAVCEYARCVPAAGVDDPSFGAGCSMQLVGAGPLANPLSNGTVQVSAPTIAAAGDGFVIAYTEFVASDGTMRLTLLPIDHDGGPMPAPLPETIDGHCAGPFGNDATGLAFGMGGGLAVLSRPPCPSSKSGVELFPLSSAGAVMARNIVTSNASPGPAILLSTHAIVPYSAGFLIALRVDGTSMLEKSSGADITSPITFGQSDDRAVRIARSDGIEIIEVEGSSELGDAGAGPSVARINLVAGNADPLVFDSFTPDDEVPATLATVATAATRAFVATDGAGSGTAVSVRAYDIGKPPLNVNFSTTAGTGPILSLDASAMGDRLFVGSLRTGSLVVTVIDGATTPSPSVLRRVSLVDDFRIPQTFVDGPITVASTDSRVAIAWSSRKAALTMNDVVGGYAVFACR